MNLSRILPESFQSKIIQRFNRLNDDPHRFNHIVSLSKLTIFIQQIELLIAGNDWTHARNLIHNAESQLKFSKYMLKFLPELKILSAWIHIDMGEFGEAETDLIHGLIIARDFKDWKVSADLNVHLGNCFYYQNNLQKAYEYYKQAEKIIMKILTEDPDNPQFLITYSSILNNLGTIRNYKKDYSEALEYFMKSLEITPVPNRRNRNYSVTMLNIADIMLSKKQYKRALDYINQAEVIFSQVQDQLWHAEILLKKGELYLTLKEYKKAIAFVKQGIKLKSKVNHKPGLIRGHKILAWIYEKQGNKHQTIKAYQHALLIAEDIHSENDIKDLVEKIKNVKCRK